MHRSEDAMQKMKEKKSGGREAGVRRWMENEMICWSESTVTEKDGHLGRHLGSEEYVTDHKAMDVAGNIRSLECKNLTRYHGLNDGSRVFLEPEIPVFFPRHLSGSLRHTVYMGKREY